jgi:type I restriction enzyme R subunit
MEAAGYTAQEAAEIKGEVEHFSKMRQEIKLASGDDVDMKQYEPAMRRLLDTYIKADDSETVIDFEELGLIELIVEKAKLNPAEASSKSVPEAMAETIENNMRKVIIDEQPINPKYYEKMSELLDALIAQRREEAISYAEYLEEVKKLAANITQPEGTTTYPRSMDSRGKQSLYDNYGKDEILVTKIDTAVHSTKKDGWKSNPIKTRNVKYAVEEQVAGYELEIDGLVDLIKKQPEYD